MLNTKSEFSDYHSVCLPFFVVAASIWSKVYTVYCILFYYYYSIGLYMPRDRMNYIWINMNYCAYETSNDLLSQKIYCFSWEIISSSVRNETEACVFSAAFLLRRKNELWTAQTVISATSWGYWNYYYFFFFKNLIFQFLLFEICSDCSVTIIKWIKYMMKDLQCVSRGFCITTVVSIGTFFFWWNSTQK
jgi:hypothetical protein